MISNSKNLESQITDLVQKLRLKFDKDIIAIIYNPRKEAGIQSQDCIFLRELFKSAKYTYPLFILSGHGGDFEPGLLFPYIIKKYVKNYKVFIPITCGSALCYTILKAHELIVGKNSHIAQIDPYFLYDGELLRAIICMQKETDVNKVVAAKEAHNLAREEVARLIRPPCLFNYKNYIPGEFLHLDNLALKFMYKSGHEKPITIKELKELEARVTEVSDEEIDRLANEFIKFCQDFTIKTGVRVIFVSSRPLKIKGEGEGRFICPLV